ncbi:MAG: hypothetical protein WD969_14775 [Paracoccaceae bacterium]
MLTLAPQPDEQTLAAEIRRIDDARAAPARPPARDWSNVVFSVAFCEEAQRDYDRRMKL